MTVAAGLVLALASACALNWGWIAQHSAAASLPPLSLRRPFRSLRSLFTNRTWLFGFFAGLGGWVAYVAALALAPLSLVQATAAGGVGVLALLAHSSGSSVAREHWVAVLVAMGGLALLGVSLGGGTPHGGAASATAVAIWLAASAVLALGATAAGVWLAAGAGLGLASGALYAAGDVATKAVTFGGGWLFFIPAVLAAHGLGFVALQLGFQRGRALETAGTASLLTNALPIAAGLALFGEHLPGGALGIVRLLGFALVIVAAAVLTRRHEADATLAHVAEAPRPRVEERPLVGAAGKAH